MATLTVSSSSNLFDLSTANGDTFIITNGARLTINADTKTYLSSIAINDGEVFVDGTTIRQVTFGSLLTIPVVGDICTCTATGASGTVIFVNATLGGGYVKLRSVSGGTGVFTATTITFTGGKTAIASAPDSPSWMLVVGMETGTINLSSRQSSFRVKGAWYTLGTSNGSLGQTFTHYTTDVLPAVWVETGSGTGVYEIWLNAGSRWAAGLSNGLRGKFFSMADGNATITFATSTVVASIPPNGARIRVPNIQFASVAIGASNSSTRTVNATLTTRYTVTTNGTGLITLDTCTGSGFYINATTAYSVDIRNSGILHAISLSGTLASTYIDNLGIGMIGTVATYTPLTLANSVTGTTTLQNSAFAAYQASSTGSLNISQCETLTITSTIIYAFARAAIAVDAIKVSNSSNIILTSNTVLGARLHVTASNNITINSTIVSDQVSGSNLTTFPISGIAVDDCYNVSIDGYTTLTGGTQPYNSFINIGSITNLKIRNIGSTSTALAAASQTGYVIETTGFINSADFSRIYSTGLRIAGYLGNSTNNSVTIQNFITDVSTGFRQVNKDSLVKASRMSNGVLGSSTANIFVNPGIIGSHFYDLYNTDTTGCIGIHFNEQSNSTSSLSSYTINSGTPVFDGKGSLLMKTAGDQIEYTWTYYILGHLSFSNIAYSTIGTVSNILFEYKLDKNTGVYDANWKTLNATNISTETIGTQGFKIKIRLTATTSLSTSNISGFLIPTNTSLTAQNSALHALDTINTSLVLTNLKINSEIKVYRSSDNLELASVLNSDSTFTYNYTWSGDVSVYIVIVHLQYNYMRLDSVTLASTGVNLRIMQTYDNFY